VVVLQGGFNGASVMSDTWEWDGANWASVATGPEPRQGHALARVPGRPGLVLCGGYRSTAPVTYFQDVWTYTFSDSVTPDEQCREGLDTDGDGEVGCEDDDCAEHCARCPNGYCDALESCRLCPDDCGACPVVCGDGHCDPGEDHATCPADCP
jgi:hypothetical protein